MNNLHGDGNDDNNYDDIDNNDNNGHGDRNENNNETNNNCNDDNCSDDRNANGNVKMMLMIMYDINDV